MGGAPKVSLQAISTPLSRGGGRIVGGSDAYHGEFPHQIALLRGGVGGSLMCGGSLVAADTVVTAAHCCDGQSASRLGVRVGSHKLHSDDEDQAAWLELSRRLMCQLSLMMTAVDLMDKKTFLTPRYVLEWLERTLARGLWWPLHVWKPVVRCCVL